MKFCTECGKEIVDKAFVCPSCGCRTASSAGASGINGDGINLNLNNEAKSFGHVSEPKNKWVALLLCFFLGCLGAHKFYEGKIGMGVLYLFTVGLFGIGVLVDLIILITKPVEYHV